ncbi:MAG: baseplate megatron protein TIM-barrel domain-containing protein, partial [Shimia sp.]
LTEPTAWVPQSKPFWFMEYGCAAIDKGTNQPNKFLDPKSSESAIPYFSDGSRDELIQLQYIRAVNAHWRDAANNPISEVYEGPMVDMSRAFVWAWDARPFPWFPALLDVWSDGENWLKGHWITGRTGGWPLAEVIAELCRRSGVGKIDVSAVWGYVRGYELRQVLSARGALQSLLLAYGVDAIERGGVLRFVMRADASVTELDPARLALRNPKAVSDLSFERVPEAETAGRVQLSFIEADGDFEPAEVEAIFPDERSFAVSASELPLALTPAEGDEIAERWLAEARIARQTARFALPPSRPDLGPGDVVALPSGEGTGLYRIDRIEDTLERGVEATRVEPSVAHTARPRAEAVTITAPIQIGPVFPLVLDLPVQSGNGTEAIGPWVAATAKRWPGSVSVFGGDPLSLQANLPRAATIGVLQQPLPGARPALWDRGGEIVVRLTRGSLASAERLRVLGGANRAVIGSGDAQGWEIVQFRDAELIGESTWRLTGLLRGVEGSESEIAALRPTGSIFCLLDSAVRKVPRDSGDLGRVDVFRVGPAARSYTHESYRDVDATPQGLSLRPLAPVHVRASEAPSGDIVVAWMRRTRVPVNLFTQSQVPLGEAFERYRVRVWTGTQVVREVTVSAPGWTYTAQDRSTDGSADRIEIAQISDIYGPGAVAEVQLM